MGTSGGPGWRTRIWPTTAGPRPRGAAAARSRPRRGTSRLEAKDVIGTGRTFGPSILKFLEKECKLHYNAMAFWGKAFRLGAKLPWAALGRPLALLQQQVPGCNTASETLPTRGLVPLMHTTDSTGRRPKKFGPRLFRISARK